MRPGPNAKACASRRPWNAPGRAFDNGFGAVRGSLALIERSKVDIGLPTVLTGRAAASAGHRKHSVHVLAVGSVKEIMLDCQLGGLGAIERGTGRKPDLDRGIALVLARNEAGREAPQEDDEKRTDTSVDGEKQPFTVNHSTDVADYQLIVRSNRSLKLCRAVSME